MKSKFSENAETYASQHFDDETLPGEEKGNFD